MPDEAIDTNPVPEIPGLTASKFTQEHKARAYEFFLVTTEYVWDGGLLQQGVAGPDGTPCSIVKTAAACSRKIVRWAITRFGRKPKLPHPSPSSSNDVLARVSIRPSPPALQDNGQTQYFKVEGTYEYFMKVPVWVPVDGAGMGKTPYDTSGPGQLTSDDFDPGLLP